MLELFITVLLVLLIIIVISLILSVFANVTLGTPTPINVLVKPISNKIGELVDDRKLAKRAEEYEISKSKSVKTYDLSKSKDISKEISKDKKETKDYSKERTLSNENTLVNKDEKAKKLVK